ncbi:hypothetical protein V1511DRAFT_509579 [Dipodascopsis uninucleata]
MTSLTVSPDRSHELIENFESVKDRLRNVADGRSNIRLVAVSKLKPAEDILALYNHGHRHFGENYAQELIEKAAILPKDIEWHFIGTLQSNKCAALAEIPNLYAVETVDSIKRANKLNDSRNGEMSKLNVFIQVNTSGEENKSGVPPIEVEVIARHIIQNCTNLVFKGLMTIGAIARSKASAHIENEDFKLLVETKKLIESALSISDLELSMGMSEDFEDAIKQGSTNIRVGSTIFGSRPLRKPIN